MKKYRIELDERQLGILVKALDLYSRIGMGQWEILSEFMVSNLWKIVEDSVLEQRIPDAPRLDKDELFSIVLDRVQGARNQINEIKRVVLGQPTNGSLGIFNTKVPEGCREAHDIQQILRKTHAEARAQEREVAGERVDRWTTDFRDYLPANPEWPPVTCEIVSNAASTKTVDDADRPR